MIWLEGMNYSMEDPDYRLFANVHKNK
jgi:hypothetical protein